MHGHRNGEIALVLQNLDQATDGKQKLSPENTVAGVWRSMGIKMELMCSKAKIARWFRIGNQIRDNCRALQELSAAYVRCRTAQHILVVK